MNGLLIQWGTGKTTGSGDTPGSVTILFPISYTSKDSYFVYLTPTSGFSAYVNYKASNSMSVEQALYNIGFVDTLFYWLTKGY